MSVTILTGDCRDRLADMPEGSVRCCVTSPPYFGLRKYTDNNEIGREDSQKDYITNLVEVFRQVRRVIKDDGTLWLNLGDGYATAQTSKANGHLKNKDRMMTPARVAIALQEDGWWLRDEIVWHKPRTTPYPAIDRTVAAHEMIYLFSKSEKYFFDWAAIEEPAIYAGAVRTAGGAKNAELAALDKTAGRKRPSDGRTIIVRKTRRARSVWSISPSPSAVRHFAMMPAAVATKCVQAGSAPGDVVLDPFAGVGTTGLVAQTLGRRAVLIEMSADYAALAHTRLEHARNIATRHRSSCAMETAK